ncbi:MAG: hypothetical protein ACXABF_01445 [Candidatus Thorarchaeota archaeon]|jgi:hypothetical protein
MGKRLVMGSEPEVDPLEQLSSPRMAVTSDTELRWTDRSVKTAITKYAAISLLILALCIWLTEFLLVICIISLVGIYLIPRIRESRETNHLSSSRWNVQQTSEIAMEYTKDSLQFMESIRTRNAVGFDLCSAGSNLFGSISTLIRALDDAQGFFLTLSMKSGAISQVLDNNHLSDHIDKYLENLSHSVLEAYMSRRGGLWKIHGAIIGYAQNERSAKAFESKIKAAIPNHPLKQIENRNLGWRLRELDLLQATDSFYASGAELSNWLVQLPSELASEVGSNIPGEFIVPIRGRPDDYIIGVAINPETLQSGPHVGMSHSDLESGLLLCGGCHSARQRVLFLLIKELLESGKRVLLITRDSESARLASLSEGGVYLQLGRDLVLNPVDAEGIPRSDYVPQLIDALRVIAGTDLRGAVDLELAISRTVALGNTTVADVRFNSQTDSVQNAYQQDVAIQETEPSARSIAGLQAIRTLHEGSGARAFYGSQTVSMNQLSEQPLSVIDISMGSLPLEVFAWDILCIKLGGLKHDSNLAIILDDAENLRIRNQRYDRRDRWSETMIRTLKKRGPLIVGLDHPVDMAPGAIGCLSSCISLRLREAPDIKIAVDMLGLGVIATGMHSKARASSRESSFLRVMEDDMALLVHDSSETCQPIRLDDAPESTLKIAPQEMTRRISHVIPLDSATTPKVERKPLLRHILGNQERLAVKVLKLLKRYEPLTEEAARKFIGASREFESPDVEGMIVKLEQTGMILRGHEIHSGVSYTNYRITMKGNMALKQLENQEGSET